MPSVICPITHTHTHTHTHTEREREREREREKREVRELLVKISRAKHKSSTAATTATKFGLLQIRGSAIGERRDKGETVNGGSAKSTCLVVAFFRPRKTPKLDCRRSKHKQKKGLQPDSQHFHDTKTASPSYLGVFFFIYIYI